MTSYPQKKGRHILPGRTPAGAPPSVVRDGFDPMYAQIVRTLATEIDEGRLRPFDKLPSEPELMARFGVSRVTVRLALRRLADAKLVVPRQGKGTFVAGPVVEHELDVLRGFYDNLLRQGHRPRTELLAFESGVPPEGAAAVLGATAPTVARFQRRYTLRGQPLALVSAQIAEAGRRISRADAERNPIYGIVQKLLGLEVIRADVSVRAQSAAPAVASTLGVEPGSPLLVMRRVSYARQGKPCEAAEICVVPERYEFRLTIGGPLAITSAIERAARPHHTTRRARP